MINQDLERGLGPVRRKYSFNYNNFIDAFLMKNNQEISIYFNQIKLSKIELHELSGISKEEWETWEDTVIIEGEISVCG